MPDIALPLLLAAVLPVFLIMAAGMLLRRQRILTPQGDTAIISLAVSVTYPCFILENIVGNESLRVPANVWLPMLCGAARFANPDALLNCFTVSTLAIFWFGLAERR